MALGTPSRVTAEFERRSELVAVTVRLERGSVEDLQALCLHHYGHQNRSEVVRLAVRLLLAREAAQVIRSHDIERHRAERAAEEARALAVAREHRDQERAEATLEGALAIARTSGRRIRVGNGR